MNGFEIHEFEVEFEIRMNEYIIISNYFFEGKIYEIDCVDIFKGYILEWYLDINKESFCIVNYISPYWLWAYNVYVLFIILDSAHQTSLRKSVRNQSVCEHLLANNNL